MSKIKYFIILIVIFSLSSCDPNMVYDHFEKNPGHKWMADDIKRFELDIQDNLSFYNVYVNIRHTKDYPKSNLYLFVRIIGPEGNEIKDTIDMQIADKHGKWTGSGFGEIKFVRKKIKESVRFSKKGVYVFEVEPGMRLQEIPVTDVGIRIEKFNPVK
ncbi:MAG: gliding motility lipoprotein GldH [Bacteroidales bacterium]|nr:gliding motility lipoprotein GldH [Bacteroidales bacterium]MCF8390527.1 gliding motility lipoprotein GldH [Bacteroidales bacterium]